MDLVNFVLLLSSISGATLSYALNNDGQCKNIPLIPGVQLESVGGRWYAQEIGDKALGAEKCMTFDLDVEKIPGGAVITVITSSLSQKHTKPDTLFPVNNTSHFKADVDQNRNEQLLKDAWLISTDYISYSLWYLCVPETENSGVVFLCTRERYPKWTVLNRMETNLKELGFDLNKSYLQDIDNRKCN